MLNKIKEKIALFLCSHLVKNLYESASMWEKKHIESDKLWTKTRDERKEFEEMRDEWHERAKYTAWEDARKKIDVVDLVREKMRSFNPKLVTEGKAVFNSDTGSIDILSDIFVDAKIAGYTSEADFLADAKKIYDNRALPIICDYIKRNQIVFTVSASKNMDQVNFNGGTINGVELVREEVGILHAIFLERNPQKEDFDPHAGV